MSDWIKVAKKDALVENRPISVETAGRRVCIALAEGGIYAIDDRCTHAEALLSAGEVEGLEIMCPLHGARFDLKSGLALTPPAVVPVRTHEVKVEGNDVFVRLRDER